MRATLPIHIQLRGTSNHLYNYFTPHIIAIYSTLFFFPSHSTLNTPPPSLTTLTPSFPLSHHLTYSVYPQSESLPTPTRHIRPNPRMRPPPPLSSAKRRPSCAQKSLRFITDLNTGLGNYQAAPSRPGPNSPKFFSKD